MSEKILNVDYESEMGQSYVDYSMSVITERALPDVRDGLKPVQRRILYSLNGLAGSDKPHRKCARIVGDTMGKYHPHGDSSIYEGLVNKFTYVQEEKLFFKAAFKNDDQNCLRDHDFQLITAFYTDQIESRTGKKISPHLQFQLEMYCQGSIFMTVQWVLGYRKCTPEELARSLAGAMPAELSDVFREVGLI